MTERNKERSAARAYEAASKFYCLRALKFGRFLETELIPRHKRPLGDAHPSEWGKAVAACADEEAAAVIMGWLDRCEAEGTEVHPKAVEALENCLPQMG